MEEAKEEEEEAEEEAQEQGEKEKEEQEIAKEAEEGYVLKSEDQEYRVALMFLCCDFFVGN